MSVLTIADIPPGYTPRIQLRSLPGLTTVGSPVTGTYASSVYSFNFASVADGDYEAEMLDVSVPTFRFYVRKTASGTFIILSPGGSSVPPPSTPNTCRVRIVATRGAVGVRARVLVESALIGRQDERAFLRVAFDDFTDNDGEVLIDLAWSSSPDVGPYRFRVFDAATNFPMHDRKVIVPNSTTAEYGDLVTST